ncbi:MAG: hydrogenase maturation nickel metallochaperone HypA [Candidatus Abyssobacteria bacterium SURF_17]|uniref:Hydrogenase maturation factor HypA n=1 Tax=Candidatus Abyssobacteria bacterium SURF_17 TaxID=2093361 RepID=A0A419EZ91_9BACT|nr:MAG: hydrogenase maturation nickel metallochaperone HypA [Candidatus Abyssubacteria bacterium SURF_17]
MHEMSIAQSILKIVLTEAQKNGAQKVKVVRIRAGQLRGIVREQLAFFFEFITKDTAAEGAVLEVEQVPIKAQCKPCEHTFMVQDYKFLCPKCQSKDVDVVEGMELAVKEIEIE